MCFPQIMKAAQVRTRLHFVELEALLEILMSYYVFITLYSTATTE